MSAFTVTPNLQANDVEVICSASGFAVVKYIQPPVSIHSASGFALVQRFEQRNENVYHPTNYGLNNTVV